MTRYCSSRGKDTGLSFEDILFNSYATDNGLFSPESIPRVDLKTLEEWSTLSYVELCQVISRLYIAEDEIPTTDLNEIISEAFNKGYDVKDIIPVVKVKDLYVAELWHGATQSFKDLAMSCVAQFLEYFNKKNKRHVTIIVSTSGDTGAAAIQAVRNSDWIDIVVMFPKERCSKVQELEMTTVLDENVHVFCGEGTCNDLDIPMTNCLTKTELVKTHRLCSINSINWTRIMAQIAHHFYAYFQVSDNLNNTVEIVIPTGGAGNIAAGVVAYLMGLPVKLVVATNVNDIVHRALSRGDFSLTELVPTIASSMDNQAPYNFERILHLLSGPDQVVSLMKSFETHGKMVIPLSLREKMSKFISSKSVSHKEIIDTMNTSWYQWNYLIDPHTAVGMCVAMHKTRTDGDCIVLSTAHAGKFLETLSAIGIECKPCERIQSLWEKPTKYKEMKKGDNWDKILMDTICSITDSKKL